jgi:hypothetical protein
MIILVQSLQFFIVYICDMQIKVINKNNGINYIAMMRGEHSL